MVNCFSSHSRLPVVNDCPGQTARVTSNLHSSSSTMAVSRVPSPPLPEVNTPVAENWCYTQVSFVLRPNHDLTSDYVAQWSSQNLREFTRREGFFASTFSVLRDEWHEKAALRGEWVAVKVTENRVRSWTLFCLLWNWHKVFLLKPLNVTLKRNISSVTFNLLWLRMSPKSEK